MSYNGPLWLNIVGSWVPRTSPHPKDTIRTPPMLEVARIRSRTSSDTFLSRFPPFLANLKSNGGRTTETRHAGKQEDTTPKRGTSLPNYLDQDSDNGKEVWIGGGGRKSSGRCSRRMTATRLRTWKVRADRRNVVMDEVAHEVSWVSEKGTVLGTSEYQYVY